MGITQCCSKKRNNQEFHSTADTEPPFNPLLSTTDETAADHQTQNEISDIKNENEVKCEWAKLSSVPKPGIYGFKKIAFVDNDGELRVIYASTIYKYDANLNEWSQKSYKIRLSAEANIYDKVSNCIYRYNVDYPDIWEQGEILNDIGKLNLKTEEINTYPICHNNGQQGNIPPNLVAIKVGRFHHLIGPTFNGGKHMIWDENKKSDELEILHDFADVPLARGVYLKSKNEILVFGGIADRTCFDTVWRYCINENKWYTLECVIPKAIEGFGCVMTDDERYVITFGGYAKGIDADGTEYEGAVDDIFVYDVTLMQWKVCRLKCPRTGFIIAVIVPGDDANILVMHAFIRFMCDGIEVKENPMDILKLVQTMYSDNDMVHLFKEELYTNHFAIKLEDILLHLT